MPLSPSDDPSPKGDTAFFSSDSKETLTHAHAFNSRQHVNVYILVLYYPSLNFKFIIRERLCHLLVLPKPGPARKPFQALLTMKAAP